MCFSFHCNWTNVIPGNLSKTVYFKSNSLIGLVKKRWMLINFGTLDEDIECKKKNVQNDLNWLLVYQHFTSILYWKKNYCLPEMFKFSGKVKIWTFKVFYRDITIQKNTPNTTLPRKCITKYRKNPRTFKGFMK